MTKLFKILITLAGLSLVAMPALAYEKGDFIFRAGVGSVEPESTAYSDSDGTVVKVDSGTALTLTGAYFLSPNWSFEVLAASPFKHDVSLGDATSQTTIATVKHLPPTFSFQYHFMPDGAFRPYVGLGLNYTTFFSEDLYFTGPGELLEGLSLSVDDSFGVGAQVAADVKLSDKWLLNFDVRWISIEADATLSDGVDAEAIPLDINPIVYSINLGYIF